MFISLLSYTTKRGQYCLQIMDIIIHKFEHVHKL